MAETIDKGTEVTFTLGPLGVLRVIGGRMVGEDVYIHKGDKGLYLRPADIQGQDGWHYIQVEINGEQYVCPAHAGMFEVTA